MNQETNQETNKLILYSYFRSSTSYRVRIALELKKLSYIYKPVHLLNNGGDQNQTEYRNLNPLGGVPTLVHHDRILSQSLAILEYLDDEFPETYQLFSKENNFQKAKMKQFCEIINADMHSFANLKLLQYLEKKHDYNPAEKEAWVQHWFTSGLISLEKIAASSAENFCFGSRVTAADALLVPLLITAERFKVNLESYPTLHRVHKACLEQPEFIKAHPFRQIDTPEEFRNLAI